MKDNIMELYFKNRNDFRIWLTKYSETSNGVWLVFGKTKTLITLSANDALEEALCFGWIDGQMKSIDSTKYLKYFSRRRTKSAWSEKNKKIVEVLRKKGIMTELGEKAVEVAMGNGTWNAPKGNPITDKQIEVLTKKLLNISPAYENFTNMSLSVRRTYTGLYHSFKTEEARQRNFEKIVDRLNKNMKPM